MEIKTEIEFMDNEGFVNIKTLSGDKIDGIIKRLETRKTKAIINRIASYRMDNYSTLREVYP